MHRLVASLVAESVMSSLCISCAAADSSDRKLSRGYSGLLLSLRVCSRPGSGIPASGRALLKPQPPVQTVATKRPSHPVS